jgi:hypothetical protein
MDLICRQVATESAADCFGLTQLFIRLPAVGQPGAAALRCTPQPVGIGGSLGDRLLAVALSFLQCHRPPPASNADDSGAATVDLEPLGKALAVVRKLMLFCAPACAALSLFCVLRQVHHLLCLKKQAAADAGGPPEAVAGCFQQWDDLWYVVKSWWS